MPPAHAPLSTRGGRPPRCRRRAALCAAAAAALAPGALAGCGSARPVPAAPVLTLSVALDVYALAQYGSAQTRAALYAQVLRGFEQQHRGLRVRQTAFLATAENQAAIVAGSAPDVFPDCCSYGSYVYAGLLLPLDPYLKRDNIAPTLFSPGMVAWLTFPTGTFALSRETDANAFALDLGVLDTLGLAYPAPSWTHGDLAKLCAATAKPAATPRRYGATFIYGGFTLLREFSRGFGARLQNSARTRQTLDTPEAVAAASWYFQDLYWPGLVTSGFSKAPGDTAIQNLDMNNVLHLYRVWGSATKWRFQPAPVYPHGHSTAMAGNFWGISATTRHADPAWELLRWLAVGTEWQRFAMRTFLFPPGLNSLLAEWQHTVESVVPPLKGKGLEAFTEAGTRGWASVAEINFQYATAAALAADGQWWTQIQARQVGVREGFVQADRQVNALEQAAPAQQAAQRQASKGFPSRGAPVARVTPGL